MQPSAYLHFLSLALHPYRPPLLEATLVSRYIYISPFNRIEVSCPHPMRAPLQIHRESSSHR